MATSLYDSQQCSANGLPAPVPAQGNSTGIVLMCGDQLPGQTCPLGSCCSPSGFCGPFPMATDSTSGQPVYIENGMSLSLAAAEALYCATGNSASDPADSQGDWRQWKPVGLCRDIGVQYPWDTDRPVPPPTAAGAAALLKANSAASGSASATLGIPAPSVTSMSVSDNGSSVSRGGGGLSTGTAVAIGLIVGLAVACCAIAAVLWWLKAKHGFAFGPRRRRRGGQPLKAPDLAAPSRLSEFLASLPCCSDGTSAGSEVSSAAGTPRQLYAQPGGAGAAGTSPIFGLSPASSSGAGGGARGASTSPPATAVRQQDSLLFPTASDAARHEFDDPTAALMGEGGRVPATAAAAVTPRPSPRHFPSDYVAPSPGGVIPIPVPTPSSPQVPTEYTGGPRSKTPPLPVTMVSSRMLSSIMSASPARLSETPTVSSVPATSVYAPLGVAAQRVPLVTPQPLPARTATPPAVARTLTSPPQRILSPLHQPLPASPALMLVQLQANNPSLMRTSTPAAAVVPPVHQPPPHVLRRASGALPALRTATPVPLSVSGPGATSTMAAAAALTSASPMMAPRSGTPVSVSAAGSASVVEGPARAQSLRASGYASPAFGASPLGPGGSYDVSSVESPGGIPRLMSPGFAYVPPPAAATPYATPYARAMELGVPAPLPLSAQQEQQHQQRQPWQQQQPWQQGEPRTAAAAVGTGKRAYTASSKPLPPPPPPAILATTTTAAADMSAPPLTPAHLPMPLAVVPESPVQSPRFASLARSTSRSVSHRSHVGSQVAAVIRLGDAPLSPSSAVSSHVRASVISRRSSSMMLDDQATAAAAAAARGGLASPTRLAPAAESDEAVAAAAADEEGARVANEEAALLPRFTRALAIADPLTHGPRIVRQPFEQHEQDELDLVVGDLVHLKRVFSDAWAFGVSEATGREGVFPLCALDPASDDDYVLVALLEDLAGLPAATPVAEFSSSDEAASSSYASGSGGTPLLD